MKEIIERSSKIYIKNLKQSIWTIILERLRFSIYIWNDIAMFDFDWIFFFLPRKNISEGKRKKMISLLSLSVVGFIFLFFCDLNHTAHDMKYGKFT